MRSVRRQNTVPPASYIRGGFGGGKRRPFGKLKIIVTRGVAKGDAEFGLPKCRLAFRCAASIPFNTHELSLRWYLKLEKSTDPMIP